MREGAGEVHSYAAAHGVADEAEGVGAGPGERGGGEGEEGLADVEAGVVGEIADAVRETSAEEILLEVLVDRRRELGVGLESSYEEHYAVASVNHGFGES